MSFSTPAALLLLPLVLGGAVWAWWGRRHGLGRRRRVVSLGIRLLIFAALILAIAGAAWQRTSDAQAVAFVGDLSASTQSGQQALTQFIDRALHDRGGGDLAALVALGREGMVEQSPAALRGLSRFESVVDPDYTNLDAGLSLGAALLPPGYRHRVVVLSDGRQNLGDAIGEAAVLRSEGVRVDVVPVRTRPGPEVRVDRIDVPANLHIGERFPIDIAISSTVTTTAALQVFEDRQLVKTANVQIGQGDLALSYQLTAHQSGTHTYRVTIEPAQDTLAQNNEASAFATVSGPPRVLVVEGAPGFGANVVAALQTARIDVTVMQGNAVPSDLATLQRYSGVVLVDVPADELGVDTMAALRTYVHDLGRGLLAIGGPNSFGVGNYGSTPLEDVLPVRMDLPKRKDLPTAAVVLIIESLESDASVDISKRAGEGVIGLLNPQDQVAVSDATGTLVVPLQHVTNKDAMIRAIQQMQPDDPLSYAPYLRQADAILKGATAQTKHIILLGDGDAQDNYQPILKQILADHIQVSTIETNAAAAQDFQTMKDIARWGGGKYYPADNVTTIPRIFVKVARTVAHTGIIEGNFYPVQDAPSPILSGISAVPELGGYVVTTPKSLATVVLASPKSDPVLAQWQYGLGRAVAWTSDSQGRWSTNWLANPTTKRIWASMLNWVLPPPQSTSISLSTSASGGVGTIAVDSHDGAAYRSVTARVTDPTGASSTVVLQPTAPDHFEAQISTGATGAYFIAVQARTQGKGAAAAVRSLTGGLTVAYPPDYRDSGTDDAFLQSVAQAGGGTVLRAPAQAFAGNAPPVQAQTSLQWPLLLLALLLLPIDVAVRRLVLGIEDWKVLLAALPWRARAEGASTAPASAPLTALREQRASRRTGHAGGPAPSGQRRVPSVSTGSQPAAFGVPAAKEHTAATHAAAAGSPPPASATPLPRTEGRSPEGEAPAPPEKAATATSKLLEAKRRRGSRP